MKEGSRTSASSDGVLRTAVTSDSYLAGVEIVASRSRRVRSPPHRFMNIPFQKEGSLSMSDQDKIHRTVLPIPDPPRSGLILYDAKDPENKYPAITQLRPPTGAPNVLLILIDDAGFGSSSAFGGPCKTPN